MLRLHPLFASALFAICASALFAICAFGYGAEPPAGKDGDPDECPPKIAAFLEASDAAREVELKELRRAKGGDAKVRRRRMQQLRSKDLLYVPKLEWKAGAIGEVKSSSAEILSVVDGQNVIVELKWYDRSLTETGKTVFIQREPKRTVLIRDTDTSGMVAGAEFSMPEVVEVAGTENDITVLDPFDMKPVEEWHEKLKKAKTLKAKIK